VLLIFIVRRGLKLCLLLASLVGTPSLAQRGGGRSGAPSGGRPAPPQSAEEASRAATAKQWADVIEKVRANSPPPPLPQIRFPSENEKLLSRLRWAEDPRLEVTRYLDKLWKDAKEPLPRRMAMETFWHDAEKPKWVRPAIEEFFRQRSNGMPLRPPDEPAEVSGNAAAVSPSTVKPEVKRDGSDKP
jgi:hypothetical protein